MVDSNENISQYLVEFVICIPIEEMKFMYGYKSIQSKIYSN